MKKMKAHAIAMLGLAAAGYVPEHLQNSNAGYGPRIITINDHTILGRRSRRMSKAEYLEWDKKWREDNGFKPRKTPKS